MVTISPAINTLLDRGEQATKGATDFLSCIGRAEAPEIRISNPSTPVFGS
jgi:hypothetical protein